MFRKLWNKLFPPKIVPLPEPTMLDRVVIRRAIHIIRRSTYELYLAIVANQDGTYVENTAAVQEQVRDRLTSLLGLYKGTSRAIEDFVLVCDATNNPPDQDKTKVTIALQFNPHLQVILIYPPDTLP